MKLSTRLLASFMLIGIMTALFGAFALDRLAVVHDAARVAEQRRLPSGRIIAVMDAELTRLRLAEVQQVLSARPRSRGAELRDGAHAYAGLLFNQSRYEPLIGTATEAELYRSFTAALRGYLADREHAIALADSGRAGLAAVAVRESSQESFERTSSKLLELVEIGVQAGVDATQRSEAQYARARVLVLGFSVFMLAVGFLLAFVFMVSVTRPLNALVRGAERIGVGDLSQRVTIHTHEEFRKLAEALNRLARSLGTAHEAIEHHGSSAGD
ncbi:MAG: Methyl-accepting chemotaxis protein [Gemmatimonadetes bacterium]|nr:Methyl-accepting chemotaxis protein [Gemmatimonadota bacterium]